ncbi:MAG: hypothetical protein IPJ77_13655 [Planctomycetes bacterium]|nr:hypothetical protein [Planctomycetota bacterium]
MTPLSLLTVRLALLGALCTLGPRPWGAPLPLQATPPAKEEPPVAELVRAMDALGIRLDPVQKLCAIEVRVGIRDDLLEYLLVAPRGQSHESLFVTEVAPRALNTALLALGVQPGSNVRIVAKEPPPTPEELRDGAAAYDIEAPSGDGFYLYAGWREAGETFFYRVEDLVRDVESGRSMRRHRWVFLGSRTAPDKKRPGETLFAAEVEGNLVNLALFEQGFTIVTSALPECIQQTIWLPNAWLLPERGARVLLLFSRERLSSVPSGWDERLPLVEGQQGR